MSPGFTLLRVSASDADDGYNGHVTHWMSSTEGKFVIEAETGLVQVKSSLDQSEKRQYSVTVFARDHGIPANIAEVSLSIFVDNSNKHSPVFSQFSNYINLLEGSSLNEPLIQFNATDKDEGLVDDILYGISRGNEEDHFVIEINSGVVGLIKDLDYEKRQFYEIEVTAMDRGEPPRSATSILHVTVTDVNDNAPVFQSFPTEVYTSQVVEAGELIFRFHATDADSSLNGNNKVRYQVVRGNDR